MSGRDLARSLFTFTISTTALATALPPAVAAESGEMPPPVPPMSHGLRVEGYVETAYTYSFGRPANGVIARRGFDNRHNTFTLSNALLGVVLDQGAVYGRLALQVGVTPTTYYDSEPNFPSEGGAGAVGRTMWRHVQEAYGGWRSPWLPGLSLDAGLFLSQIGLEPMAVRDAWQWSRSNLFYGLPFYHTGLRVHQTFAGVWTATAAVFNGWNSVVDNNENKSISVRLGRATAAWEAAALYFGGAERAAADPEGRPWRHLFDLWGKTTLLDALDLAAQANVGWEHSASGTVSWRAAAFFARLRVKPWLWFSSRTDAFLEEAPEGAQGRLTFFFGADRVLSQTTTLALRPHDKLIFMLEQRHDNADGPIYFSGSAPMPTARRQNTVTVGMVLTL